MNVTQAAMSCGWMITVLHRSWMPELRLAYPPPFITSPTTYSFNPHKYYLPTKQAYHTYQYLAALRLCTKIFSMSLVGFFKNAGLFIMGNNQFKLIFPSHAMPFTLPGGEIPNIVAKVDQLLCDMEKKGITKYGGFTIPASDGGTITIDMPTTGDWVLVDTYYKTVIHASLATSMVVVGGTYMVLPLRAAGLKAADLKRACEEAAAPSLPTMASPPPRYNEESQ